MYYISLADKNKVTVKHIVWLYTQSCRVSSSSSLLRFLKWPKQHSYYYVHATAVKSRLELVTSCVLISYRPTPRLATLRNIFGICTQKTVGCYAPMFSFHRVMLCILRLCSPKVRPFVCPSRSGIVSKRLFL